MLLFQNVLERLGELDTAVFRVINTAWHVDGGWAPARLVSDMGGGAFLFVTALVLMLPAKKRLRMTGLLLMAGLTFTYHIVTLIKEAVERPRPFMALQGANVFVPAGGYSFPSNHAAMAFMAAFVLANCFRKSYFYILACAVGYSRVYLGVHYPSDVLAGALLGTFIGYVITRSAETVSSL